MVQLESPILHSSVDLGLHLSPKETQNEVRSHSLNFRHGGCKRCKEENCTKRAKGLSYRCTFPECNKWAEGSTSTLLCKDHGAGKRCSFEEGCTKSVREGTLFCVAHGGVKRCAVPECRRSARGKTNFCVRHDRGKRCQHEGCRKSALSRSDFCKAHGGERLCLWGLPGSQFGAGAVTPCDEFARGKIGLCAAHNAYVQDKCVLGESTVIDILQDSEPTISSKGKEIATVENAPCTRGPNKHLPNREDVVEGISCKIPRFAASARRCHGELLKKMEQRNRRPARYPAGIDQIIQQVDILKCGSFIAVVEFGLIATNRPLGMWFYLILSLLVSQLAILTLKEKLPEVAALAVVAGVLTVSLLVLIIGYEFGGVPLGPLFAAAFILVAMVIVWAYTIIKEDVRAPEEEAIELGESTLPHV